ncbi:MAG: hypothetical protein E3J72_09790 [Planctomycetota bacterium]|nr:MAG: hypothetical protein E3J72_09790 [Planctomycetota bacterium]
MYNLHRYFLVISIVIAFGLVFSAGCSSGGGKKKATNGTGSGTGTGTGTGTSTGTGTGTGTTDPSGGSGGPAGKSTQNLGGRDCIVYVPSSYEESSCVPLLITWHGAGGAPSNMMPTWEPVSDSHGFIVVAPPHNGSGTDSAHAPGVRTEVAALYNIDLNACYVNGFSAGGQTAFHAGIGQNGWAGIMAFSAGPRHTPPMPNASGLLPIYWVFGDADSTFGGIAKIRQQVQQVKDEGHNVNFKEIPGGGHDLNISDANDAWTWTTNPANRP